MNLVEGQCALVTGGATGIGFGVAKRLLEEGAARVVIVGRREDVLRDARAELQRFATTDAVADYRVCDITDEDQVVAAVAAACNDAGELDILVANAGSGFPGPILKLDAAAWRYCCELNIVGTALCIKHAAAAMRKKGGSITTISSTSARHHDRWMAPYGVSKAGLEHLSRCAAIELAPFDIRVNSVAPGFVTTEATVAHFPDALARDCIDRTLLRRPGTPEELGDAVVFLSSSLARWVTGQVIGVDGGLGVHVGMDFGELAQLVVGEEAMAGSGYRPAATGLRGA